jgi:glycosyltransferase involved in cell wall biosynthesis
MSKKRLAIISSHPIQYNAPIFRLLNERDNIKLKVFYTWGVDSIKEKFDPGFGKSIQWDIPLLEGYEYEFLENIAIKPGSDHFNGISNPDIIEKINEYHPDALLIFGWAFKSHLRVLRHFKGKYLIIFRGDSTLLGQSRSVKSVVRKLFLSWVYRHVDKSIYVGKHNFNYYKAFGLKEDQLVLAPHAIDNYRFGTNDMKYQLIAADWRKKLGIAEEEFVFVYAGKLEPVKNVALLLKSFSSSQVYQQTHLVIVGNGPLEKEFKEQYGNKARIHFLPFQNQSAMPAVYRIGKFFVLPSSSETWGLAINESFASGIPVIASDACGGAPELIEEGVNGFLFESNNQESLKAALEKAWNVGSFTLKHNRLINFSQSAHARSSKR